MRRLINAGFGNMVAIEKVVAIISPNSAPAKRLKDEAKEDNRLVDITQGRRTRSMIITVSNQIILTAVQVETLATRFHQEAERTPLGISEINESK
ncbi:MAG: extracellular matrix/biofilm biosynthesis regulator RemA family protein [Candidatus Adiutrix sp.]